MSATRYALWRQDDNGSRHLVSTHPDRQAADDARCALERGGHKQVYWVLAIDPATNARGAGIEGFPPDDDPAR